MPQQRHLIPLAEAAKRLGVDPVTLRRWGAQGRIHLYRIGPRFLRVDVDELDALVEIVNTAGDPNTAA